ncbi:MAG: hypothetical protein H6732_16390 [Alphaproteobacteria bacterium]|nr:hypothetical protein [Alphaproteobacteria bacterium]
MMVLLLATALAGSPPSDDPGTARPVRHWDVTDVRLDVVIDPTARTVEGTVEHDVQPVGLPEPFVRLHQVALDIDEVQVDGAVVAPRLGTSTLDVPVVAGQPHTVRVRWSATPQSGVHFRGRDDRWGALEAWTQGEDEDNRHWFPAWDHPSDTSPVAISLTVPDGLHAVANGFLVGKAPTEGRPGWTTWRYRLEQPIVTYLVAFTVGEHAVHVVDGPVHHEIIAAKGIPAPLARRGFDRSPAMMTWFATLLDEPFPYPIYRQVIVQRFLYGGMENATTTLMADGLLAEADGLGRWRTESVTAHELAHQWFGDLLTCHGWRELWLNEGFATFYAARWVEHAYGEEAYAASVLGWSEPAAGTRTPMANRGWAAPGGPSHTAQYVRGASVLHMLRSWLGDALFDRAIAAYVDDHRFGLVETADLRQAFEAVSGQDLRWFFDRWVHGWGAPTLETRWAVVDGRVRVTITQAPPEAPATPYTGPVRVDWADADGAVHTERLRIAPGTTTLFLDAPDAAWVAVDPVGGVLAHWTRHQPPAAWAAQLAGAPTAHARLVAIDALGEAEGDATAAVTALAGALRGEHRLPGGADPDFTLQHQPRRAAEALGKLGTPAARDALLAGLPGAPPEVRDAIAEALGELALDDVAVGALTRLTVDPHPEVAGTALTALAKARPSRALPLARQQLARRDGSLMHRPLRAALEVVGEHGEPVDLNRVLSFTDDPHAEVQRAAGDAAVALATDDDAPEAARERVARAVEPWLLAQDQRARHLGVLLLSRLGARSSLGPLSSYASLTTIPEHAEAARAAMTRIRARTSEEDPDALAEALARLEALQERLDGLTKRLETLEAW